MGTEFLVYGTANCGYCQKAKELLTRMGKDFTYLDLADHPDEAQRLLREGFRSVPQIYQNGDRIGGYTDLFAYLSQGA